MTDALGGTTRRQFLARGGALAGAALMAGGAAALLPARGRAQATALTAARRATYTALVEVVVTGPSMRLDAAVAPEAATRFAVAYEGWPVVRRRDADAVLDALERASGGGFSRLDRRSRGEALRAGARPATARPAAAEREYIELTARALGLAAVVLAPSDSGHEIVTV
jgi:hypothetical protein